MPESLPEISPTDGRAAVAAGATLLDVREADEWTAGRAPEAVWIPMGEVPARIGEVPADGTVVVICRAGGRSARVVEFLRGQGVDAVNLTGGMQAWAAAGLDVVTETGTPGAVI